MWGKPAPFGHDAKEWREQARGFAKAAEAAAAIADDTKKAATEAVWKGPMPADRLERMQEQTLDAARTAEALDAMSQACYTIADAAETASGAIDDMRKDWDIVDGMGMGDEPDDVQRRFTEDTASARATLAERADDLQPVIDRGDPLDFLFGPIQVPGGPPLGEQLDEKAADEYFETGKLVDPAHVDDIQNRITGLSEGPRLPWPAEGPGNPPADWNEWAESNGYNQEEIQAALDGLDANERANLDQWLADNKGDPALGENTPNSDSVQLASFLWQNMTRKQISEFHDDVPSLEPDLHGDADGWVDGDVDMSVDFDVTDGGTGIEQINQGSIGECATLASIAASVSADPGWVDEHIKQNPNGTFTVTIYDDSGDPVDVTVNGHIPADGGNPIYNGRDLDGEINWVSIYEKAMAQYQGGDYESIDGAFTNERVEETSGEGETTKTELPADANATFDEMQEAFENGKPIVMGGDGHAYAVVGFENGRVLVMNPWGRDGSTIAMTPEEFNSGEFPEPADDWPDFTYVAVTE